MNSGTLGLAAVTVACWLALGSGLRAQAAGDAHAPKPSSAARAPRTVELTTGQCVNLAEGDSLTFDWNPGFDHPGSVTGMQKALLIFARRGEEQDAIQGHGGIALVAMTSIERAGLHDATIAALPNGFYRIVFRPFLTNVPPGEYHLVSARADARVDARVDARADTRSPGVHPLMTNDPTRSPFCINVVATSASRD